MASPAPPLDAASASPPPQAFATAAHGRVALVTGAGRRLGRLIALALARRGWHVAVHHRLSAQDARQTAADCVVQGGAGVQADTVAADLCDEAAVRRLLPVVVERFGRVDAVVNSASTFEHDEAATFSYAALQTHVCANTGAPILLAQALRAHAEARGGAAGEAAVVNLLDQKLWNPNPDFLSYTLSKAALESANTLLAMALAPWVRVVGVAPGLTLTSHMLSDDRFAELHRQSPLGRSSTPEDVVATVCFALETRSLTGTTLLVDGGQHLMRFERDFSLM